MVNWEMAGTSHILSLLPLRQWAPDHLPTRSLVAETARARCWWAEQWIAGVLDLVDNSAKVLAMLPITIRR
jgi:hypothetical protein